MQHTTSVPRQVKFGGQVAQNNVGGGAPPQAILISPVLREAMVFLFSFNFLLNFLVFMIPPFIHFL
jgi:hypothetical protein